MESLKPKHHGLHVEVSSLVSADKGGWINVRDLPEKTSENELKILFAKFGKVLRVTINTNLQFASVKMDTRENAQNAINNLNGIALHGKRVSLNLMSSDSPTTCGPSHQKDNISINQGRAVKVENLSPMVTNELLKKAFLRFGPVNKAVVIVDCRGCSTTRGIVEFVSVIDAQNAVKQIQENCFLLTSSPRPVTAILMEEEDSNHGLTDEKMRKTSTFYKEIQVGPRMAEIGSFEEECARTWKVHYQVERQQRENFEEEMRLKRVILESKIDILRIEESGRSQEEVEARKRVRMETKNMNQIVPYQSEDGEPPRKKVAREQVVKSGKSRCEEKIDQLHMILELEIFQWKTQGHRRCERIKHAKELIYKLVNEICYCMAVIFDLEKNDVDPYNLGDIDTLLFGVGINPLENIMDKTTKEKVDLCRAKMKDVEFYLASKLEKKARLTGQQISEDVEVKEEVNRLLTFDESIPWKKQETGRVSILTERMSAIITICVEHLGKKLKTTKDAKFLYISILAHLIKIELPALKLVRAGKHYLIKRALSQFTDVMTPYLCQRYLFKCGDFDEQSACLKEFYLTKCFTEFCMKMATIFKGCDRPSRKRFLTTVLQKATAQTKILPLIAPPGMPDNRETFGENLQFSRESVIKATEFYLKDEYSTQLPNSENYISHILGISVQKRMLLSTISELFAAFKREYPQLRMGRSRFYSLRPDWVELESAKEVEMVCEKCENIKLKTHAIPGRPHYMDLLRLMVCDLNNHNCVFDVGTDRMCINCPGGAAVEELLKSLNFTNEIVNYTQWSEDKKIVVVNENIDDFINNFAIDMYKLKEHFAISKHQSDYLKQLKLHLPDNEVIAVLDFSQNYPFICQYGEHGRCSNEATIHPIIIYHRDTHDVVCKHFCFISDTKSHSTNAVHAFMAVLVEQVKSLIPNLEKIHYFSDDAHGYKDFKNLSNLIHHAQDFHVEAEWNFYPICHGKSCPDMVAGTIKRLVRKESIHRDISTVTAMYEYLKSHQNIDISLFLLTEEDIRIHSEKFQLKKRFQEVKRFTGMHKLYSFKMLEDGRMLSRKVSGMSS